MGYRFHGNIMITGGMYNKLLLVFPPTLFILLCDNNNFYIVCLCVCHVVACNTDKK